MSGLFITFEGPDGSGKSTQLNRLSQTLIQLGYDVVTTREPGGTPISDKIREIILDPQNEQMTSEAEVLLYAASRAQHVGEKIIPALKEGKIVLSDRFVDASIAYQGIGLNIGVDVVKQINAFATQGIQPHKTFIIDVSPECGRARMSARHEGEFEQTLDRIEQKELDYHQRVRDAFIQLAGQESRITLIDGNDTIDIVHQNILKEVETLLASMKK